MGFIKEVYSNNRAGLRVAFEHGGNISNYFEGDSVEEAMKYFGMYLNGDSIFIKTEDEVAINSLGIEAKEAVELRSSIDAIIASLSDEQAVASSVLFPRWQEGVAYEVGARIRYNEKLYKVLQAHTSQADWTPDAASSLFATILTDEENGEVLEWVQPDSTNPYMKGDQVIHNEVTYESLVDNNVWEPGATDSETLWAVVE